MSKLTSSLLLFSKWLMVFGQVLEAVHGVTHEEAAVALYENQWNFTIAVQQLKVMEN